MRLVTKVYCIMNRCVHVGGLVLSTRELPIFLLCKKTLKDSIQI